ncbi:MAG TPA: hypothetical protein VHR47_04445 [Bacillota bacterium]|nr:hypothetical protein [Bacillota bacterium]
MKTRMFGVIATILLLSIGTFAAIPHDNYIMTLAGAKEPNIVVTDQSKALSFELALTKYSIDINFVNNTKNLFTVDWEKSSFVDFDGKSSGLYLSTNEPIKDITVQFNDNEPLAIVPAGRERLYSILPKSHYIDGAFPKLVPLLPRDAGAFIGKKTTLTLCCRINNRMKNYLFNFVVSKIMLEKFQKL